LVHQKIPEAAGRSEMAYGLRLLEELRAEARKAQAKAARDARRPALGINATKGQSAKPKAKVVRPKGK
jgi:hypothetical protein